MSTSPEALVRRLIEEGFNQGNPDVADALISPDLVEHQDFGPDHAAKLLNKASRPVLVAGSKLRPPASREAFLKLADASGYAVASVRGELDLRTVDQLDALTARAREEPLILDLSECTFVDSRGLQRIVEMDRSALDAGHVVIVVPHPWLWRTLQVAGLDRVLELAATREIADQLIRERR